MAIVRFFRDPLAIDSNIAALLTGAGIAARPGDTLVLGGRACTIASLPGDFDYVIVADKLSLTGTSSVVVNGTDGNHSPDVTILAVEIDGPFGLVCRGSGGPAGANGIDGADGEFITGNGKPHRLPPRPGGAGRPGGPGSPGGQALVHYCTAQQVPTAGSPGGVGGPGGAGGAPGQGVPKAARGANGARGPDGPSGHAEVLQVDLSQIWAPLDADSAVAWATFRGASITIWNRLEPRSRAQDLRPGLEARVFDPLWLLARQWQIGEFAGRDAGSPIAVDMAFTRAPFDRYAPAGQAARPYDGMLPLEALAEREPVRPAAAENDLRQAAESGLHFARLLDAGGLSRLRGAYLTQYPLSINPALYDAEQRFAAVIAGRAIDGVALQGDLVRAGSALPSAPALSDADRAAVLPISRAWLAWYGSLFSEAAGAPAWMPERMEYAFSVGAPGESGSFIAREYDGGSADWHTFDRTTATLTGGSGQRSTAARRALVTPVAFRGMPARRFWEFEDASVDIGSLSAAPEDIGRLLLRDFALIYGSDWFLAPLSMPVGSAVSIDSFKVSDTFGLVTTIPHYTVADGAAGRWQMFALSADSAVSGAAPDHRLFVPSTAVSILDSDPVEHVLLLRDEMADMAWGVERTMIGASGFPVDRALAWKTAAQPDASSASGLPRYRLGSSVPDYWIPFLPVQTDSTHLRFRRGALATAAAAPLGRLLGAPGLAIFPEELPREGVRLEMRFRCARGADGSTYLWLGRRRSTGRGEGRSGLRFDYLES